MLQLLHTLLSRSEGASSRCAATRMRPQQSIMNFPLWVHASDAATAGTEWPLQAVAVARYTYVEESAHLLSVAGRARPNRNSAVNHKIIENSTIRLFEARAFVTRVKVSVPMHLSQGVVLVADRGPRSQHPLDDDSSRAVPKNTLRKNG
jgi:hypothetical protein